jgi:hypothetical protein
MNKAAAAKKSDKNIPAKEDKARSKSKAKEEKKPEKVEKEKPEKKQAKKKEESDSEESVAEVKIKKSMSSYMFFNMDNRERVKKDNPGISNKDILSVN